MEKEVNRKGFLVAVIVTLFWGGLVLHFAGREAGQEPDIVLWSDQYHHRDPVVSAEIAEVYRRLRETILPEVNFHETPFGEAVRQLENSVRQSAPDLEPVIFRIADEVPGDAPITLKLKDVPVGEALRYLAVLNRCRYDIEPGRIVTLDHLDAPLETAPIEGWFAVPPVYFQGIDLTKDPDAVRRTFERVGVDFSPSDTVEYFPDRSLLRASTSRDNLELIDAYVSSCIVCYTPTWRDHLAEWWYQTKVDLRLAPAPVPPAATPTLAPDPFGSPP